jgi:hypothetical protein
MNKNRLIHPSSFILHPFDGGHSILFAMTQSMYATRSRRMRSRCSRRVTRRRRGGSLARIGRGAKLQRMTDLLANGATQ